MKVVYSCLKINIKIDLGNENSKMCVYNIVIKSQTVFLFNNDKRLEKYNDEVINMCYVQSNRKSTKDFYCNQETNPHNLTYCKYFSS